LARVEKEKRPCPFLDEKEMVENSISASDKKTKGKDEKKHARPSSGM
jgi:hypothetical protein